MPSGPWTDAENDLTAAACFVMLAEEVAGRPDNSAADRRGRLPLLQDRPEGAIEFKLQNISAVLKCLGEVWIIGYKPAFNFQMSLVDAVARWLAGNAKWTAREPAWKQRSGVQERTALWIGPPPTLANQPPPDELERMLGIARKVDVAGRDERNRALGRAGQELALDHVRFTLRQNGRDDLAGKVRWLSEEDGDGAGSDIASFDPDGHDRFIEVKTTNGWDRTPVFITRNELAVADERSAEWRLLRLWDFSREPKAFELQIPTQAAPRLRRMACVSKRRRRRGIIVAISPASRPKSACAKT
ncbi:MAG: DUF3883 domain-containing protein [Alphaproteobacteria bacterium]|nr:DUF3883 domain-containing protein [Alphaproteobacteria bacterium]